MTRTDKRPNMDHWQERVDLAAAFRWTVRLNMHEAVANHFSLAINDEGTKFLMNPNQVHFSRIKASDLIEVDANDPTSMEGPDAPDQRRGAFTAGCIVIARTHAVQCTFTHLTLQLWLPLLTAACRLWIRMGAHFSIAT